MSNTYRDITEICRPILNDINISKSKAVSTHLPLQPPFSPTIPQQPQPHPYAANHVKHLCRTHPAGLGRAQRAPASLVPTRTASLPPPRSCLGSALPARQHAAPATGPKGSRCFNCAKHIHGRRSIYLIF